MLVSQAGDDSLQGQFCQAILAGLLWLSPFSHPLQQGQTRVFN